MRFAVCRLVFLSIHFAAAYIPVILFFMLANYASHRVRTQFAEISSLKEL